MTKTKTDKTDAPKAKATKSKAKNADKKAIEELEQKLKAKDAEHEEMKSELLYQRAELENFKRRTLERHQQTVRYAAEPVVRDLLPALDNLQRAMEHSEGCEENVLEGLRMTLTQFEEALKKNGVERMEAMGEKFDPNLHEAMAQVPGEADNIVVAVHEEGYTLHGKMVRPARVIVSRLATS